VRTEGFQRAIADFVCFHCPLVAPAGAKPLHHKKTRSLELKSNITPRNEELPPMRCVIQRVTQASVSVAGEQIGTIQQGFMVLIGVSTDDTDHDVHYMAEKVPNLRIFEDEAGKMNRSLKDVGGAILAVSQFTLYGDARGGRRPSFIAAARPEEANEHYEQLVAAWRAQGIHVETGRFRADMQVSLVNDGPVTILMDSTKAF
jgi:D-tyrosyl-tRNA(Tyr) deacylase